MGVGIGCSFALLRPSQLLLFCILVSPIICGQLMPADWARVVILEPRRQTWWMENMGLVAGQNLHLISNIQLVPAMHLPHNASA